MRAAVLLAAGLALSGCAPASTELSAASASQNQCFQARLARTYTRISPDTLLVEAGVSGSYRMELLDTCPDLEWTNEAIFRGRSGGTFVCSALDAEIVLPRDGLREVCLFSRMTPISAAEATAFAGGPRRVFRPWRPEQPRWPPIIRRPEPRAPVAPTPSP
jgi:hypothetical protein